MRIRITQATRWTGAAKGDDQGEAEECGTSIAWSLIDERIGWKKTKRRSLPCEDAHEKSARMSLKECVRERVAVAWRPLIFPCVMFIYHIFAFFFFFFFWPSLALLHRPSPLPQRFTNPSSLSSFSISSRSRLTQFQFCNPLFCFVSGPGIGQTVQRFNIHDQWLTGDFHFVLFCF